MRKLFALVAAAALGLAAFAPSTAQAGPFIYRGGVYDRVMGNWVVPALDTAAYWTTGYPGYFGNYSSYYPGYSNYWGSSYYYPTYSNYWSSGYYYPNTSWGSSYYYPGTSWGTSYYYPGTSYYYPGTSYYYGGWRGRRWR